MGEDLEHLRKVAADLLTENQELTRALTGLTCNGSEFFIRKGDRYTADIAACVQYVERGKRDSHRRTVDAILARKAAESTLTAQAARIAELEATLGGIGRAVTSIHGPVARAIEREARAILASNPQSGEHPSPGDAP